MPHDLLHIHDLPLRSHSDTVPLPHSALLANVIVVVLPFIGVLLGIIFFWDSALGWLNMGMLVGGYLLTILGITVGYHRLFTHKSFSATWPVTLLFGILGSMAIEGPILQWVATHRRHHQHTDDPEDPHSPHQHEHGLWGSLKGAYHAHIGWFFTPTPSKETMQKYVPDLLRDPIVRFISRTFGLWAALGLIIPAMIGLWVTGTWQGALSGFLWGGIVRVFLVHHVTFSVNSACHLWGRRSFNTRDHSRNNAIFGLLALGEGWHNNHHAFPSSARQGLAWWQLDLSYMVIRALGLLRLVRNVKTPSRERLHSFGHAGNPL